MIRKVNPTSLNSDVSDLTPDWYNEYFSYIYEAEGKSWFCEIYEKKSSDSTDWQT